MSITPYILIKCPECQVSEAIKCDAEKQDLIIADKDILINFKDSHTCKTCNKEIIVWEYLGIAPDPYSNNIKGVKQ